MASLGHQDHQELSASAVDCGPLLSTLLRLRCRRVLEVLEAEDTRAWKVSNFRRVRLQHFAAACRFIIGLGVLHPQRGFLRVAASGEAHESQEKGEQSSSSAVSFSQHLPLSPHHHHHTRPVYCTAHLCRLPSPLRKLGIAALSIVVVVAKKR